MYQPRKYKNDSPDFIYPFIYHNPFATLVVQGSSLLATHVPVLVEGEKENFKLYAHIANHNPMREFLEDNVEMLVIFKGPDAYISSSWYSQPDIPTWDYNAVHINAKVQMQSSSELHLCLENLIDRFERDQQHPLNWKDIPQEIWNENFTEITGFWLHPFKSVGIEKLHQGFDRKDVTSIVQHLMKDSKCPMEQMGKLLNNKHETRN